MYKNNKIFNEAVNFNNENLSANEQLVYEKKVENAKIGKINEKDFIDVYHESEINNDLETINKIKQSPGFSPRHDKAIILEKILSEQIEMSAWLGDCVAIETSEYDDIKNQTDFVIEINNSDNEPLKFAIDVKVTDDYKIIKEKADKIINKLKHNKGAEIKYFESELSNAKGKIDCLPHVLVVLNTLNFRNLCDLVADNINGQISKKDLANEPYQFVIIEEIIDQLQKQIDYYKENHIGKLEKSKIYNNLIKIKNKISEINENKLKHGNLKDPRVGLDSVIKVNFS
ncbi:hypothetical protein DRH27_00775 [Candidatus Falkowbacteria bacterium]|nr:MAG: hypothetical protein DRH27_00775 [Candidatus Falkowbacteria bacterium]